MHELKLKVYWYFMVLRDNVTKEGIKFKTNEFA